MTALQMSTEDARLLHSQADVIIATLDKHIPADRPVAILQFPMDGNVGNHMMWLAIVRYLESRGKRPAYVAHEWNFDLKEMIRAIGNDGTVLFLGGVTLSRLWPGHAKIKRTVAAACPQNRLVSLPSTMLFVDDEDRRDAGKIFGNHPNVVLMARDPVSAASAREVFPEHIAIITVHDSTLILPPQPRVPGTLRHDVIWLARDDKEGAGFNIPADVKIFDWKHIDLSTPVVVAARVSSRLRQGLPAFHTLTNKLVRKSYKAISEHFVSVGNTLLDEGKVLVTDRMHPHILAALRGQPSVMLPDRFGKNRAVWEYSSRDYSTVNWAHTPAEALELARDLAANYDQ